MPDIKVIEVSSDTNIGGAGKCLLTLLENFDYNEFDVSVILPKNSLLKPHIDKLGIRVTEVDGIADKSLDFKAVKQLREIFRREKPDIVHTHASMSARIAAKQAGCKVVYTRHSVFEPSKRISKGIGKLINGAVNNHYADAIIAVAEAAKENLTDTGIRDSKIEVILNGVDGLSPVSSDEKRMLKERFGLPEGCKAVSIVARLEDIKGHDYFIEAADILLRKGIRAKFYIAGTGSYEQHLKDKVKELCREEQIIFTGFITDVDKLMAITDIQANASYGTEATSLALLEGMSIGIPAVVSDFGGNPGVIKSGVNGYVVPKQNAEELAKKLAVLLENDDIYEELSKGARKIFSETFTSDAMTRRTEDVYIKLMRDKEDKEMPEKKKKFTAIDVIIILIVIAALAFGVTKLLPSILHPSGMQHITFTVMLQQQDRNFADAVHEGDRVTISLTEKDGGVVREVRSEDATAIAFNSIEGIYANEIIEGKQDVYVTIEADVKTNDLALKAGGTAIKVGAEIPVRGKGYASMGYVVEIHDGEESGSDE